MSETDNPELAEKVKVGLAEVIDPEIGLNVIQLGLIRNVQIEPENADDQYDPDHPVLPLWTSHD